MGELARGIRPGSWVGFGPDERFGETFFGMDSIASCGDLIGTRDSGFLYRQLPPMSLAVPVPGVKKRSRAIQELSSVLDFGMISTKSGWTSRDENLQ